MRYSIKSVPGNDAKALENLLNEMSEAGWDLYSMHEVEDDDDGFNYNCIFVTDKSTKSAEEQENDVVNISNFKSQMEKMLSSDLTPYESCKEIQSKIQDKRAKINKIKTSLEAHSETPVTRSRQKLNDEMSDELKELDILRQELLKTISPDLMYSKIRQEKLAIHLSEEILDLVNPDCGADLVSETVNLRQKMAENFGYVIPKIVFKDDDELNSFEFNIKIRELEILRASVYPGYRMFFEDELNLTRKKKDAIYAVDLISGRQLIWLKEEKTKDFWEKGMTPSEAVCRLLDYAIITNIEDILDYADINKYMEIVGEKNMFLIENIIPDFVSVAELRYILVNLLRERISIKDIVYIFEKINDFSDEETKEDLLDKIRLSLGKHITANVVDEDGTVQAFGFSDKTYASLFSKLNSDETIVKIEGKKIEKIAKSLLRSAKKFELNIDDLKIIVPIEVRHMTFMIMSQFIPNITVIAREELSNECKIDLLEEI